MNARYMYIVYQSLEVCVTAPLVLYTALLKLADEDTLVVGYGFPGHHWDEQAEAGHEAHLSAPSLSGTRALTGLNCPWNTLALWSTARLFRTGFLATLPEGDATDRLHEFPMGVEEASAIAIQQAAWPASSRAKLVFFRPTPGLQARWHVSAHEPHRALRQAHKMASKVSRTKAHLDYLALAPVVEVVNE